MVQLATKGNRHFMVSEAELRRSGLSYTIDTVRHFAESSRGRNELYLLIGGEIRGLHRGVLKYVIRRLFP